MELVYKGWASWVASAADEQMMPADSKSKRELKGEALKGEAIESQLPKEVGIGEENAASPSMGKCIGGDAVGSFVRSGDWEVHPQAQSVVDSAEWRALRPPCGSWAGKVRG